MGAGDVACLQLVSRQNQLQAPLYDAANGGCRDGLHADRTNRNHGAESTLAFLLSLVDMGALDSEMRLREAKALEASANGAARGSV